MELGTRYMHFDPRNSGFHSFRCAVLSVTASHLTTIHTIPSSRSQTENSNLKFEVLIDLLKAKVIDFSCQVVRVSGGRVFFNDDNQERRFALTVVSEAGVVRRREDTL